MIRTVFSATFCFGLSCATMAAAASPSKASEGVGDPIVDPTVSEGAPSVAGAWHRIGYGRLINNDLWGDGKDRWRTGSVASSRIYARGWSGKAPAEFGALWELRLMGQIISPANLRTPNADERPYAGALSIGLHNHIRRGPVEASLGADLVVIGPQTGLDDLQDALHDAVDATRLSDTVRASQIGNTLRPTLVGEIARSYYVGSQVNVRPFAELRAGDETLARVGFDLTVGQVGQGELLVRDPVSGQRYRTMYRAKGASFTLGGDIAHVTQSVYLPSDAGVEIKDTRLRLRSGLHWSGQNSALFFGVTYLGEEFVAQSEGQVVGSLRLRWVF